MGTPEAEAEERPNMPIQLEKEDIQEMMAQAMRTALEAKPAPSGGGKVFNEDGEIDAVSVKLPTFWSENPEAWFLRAESQFNTKGIKQDKTCLLYTSPSPRDKRQSRMPSSA